VPGGFDFVDYFLLICESTLDVRVPSSTCVDLAGGGGGAVLLSTSNGQHLNVFSQRNGIIRL